MMLVVGAGKRGFNTVLLPSTNYHHHHHHLPSLTRSIRKVKPLGTGHGVMARARQTPTHTDKHQNPYLQMLGSKVC